MEKIAEKIFNINSEKEFSRSSLEVFAFQYNNNPLYRKWCDLLKKDPENVKEVGDIPFLPIEFFKHHEIISGTGKGPFLEFTSSSTTSQKPSTHFVKDPSVYEESFLRAFKLFYGDPQDFCFLALLPNYLERTGSSLVYMCAKLITLSENPMSGFFLRDTQNLIDSIQRLKKADKKQFSLSIIRADGSSR